MVIEGLMLNRAILHDGLCAKKLGNTTLLESDLFFGGVP